MTVHLPKPSESFEQWKPFEQEESWSSQNLSGSKNMQARDFFICFKPNKQLPGSFIFRQPSRWDEFRRTLVIMRLFISSRAGEGKKGLQGCAEKIICHFSVDDFSPVCNFFSSVSYSSSKSHLARSNDVAGHFITGVE